MEKLSDLPNPVNYTGSIHVQGKFLIAGCENTLSLYNAFLHTYEAPANDIEVSFRNVIGASQGTVYLISNKIYEQDDENFKKWKVISNSGLTGENIATSAIVWKGSIFFADWTGKVYKFDCSKKILKIFSTLV